MLNFPLTYYWFYLVHTGLKNHEYRVKTDYWIKRISKLKPNDTITFSRGYDKYKIYAMVQKVTEIYYFDLPVKVRIFMNQKGYINHKFYDIQFLILGTTR